MHSQTALDENETRTGPASAAAESLHGVALSPGTRVSEYTIERPIGLGGCGRVYRAYHPALGRRAAIKVLHALLTGKAKMVERFVREALVVNLLQHRNIVTIYELGKLEDGRPYCIMEHVPGATLDAILRERVRLSLDEALDILEPVCEALQAAHGAGIVHRDIKPSNVMVCDDAGRRVIKLLDFGIAKLTDPELGTGFTTVGRTLGTVGAMAPEQITCSPVDARADVYALGVLLFRLLCGRPPFSSMDPVEITLHHLETPPPRPSQFVPVSPSVDAVVLRSMEKSPSCRYESARAFLSALREAAGRPAISRDDALDREGSAAAIYVELRIDTEEDELDDALAADVAAVLDLAEARLRAAEYTLLLTTGAAVLGARPLPAMRNKSERRRERHGALMVAASLQRAIEARLDADPRVHAAVCAHVDSAVIRTSPRPEVIGGPVTRMTLWALPEGARGLCATPEVLDDLPDCAFEAMNPRPARVVLALP